MCNDIAAAVSVMKRIRYTCEHYPVRDSYLIDVLSHYPIRNDWDPAHPASGIKNLTEGCYQVPEGFKKCGLDVVSEQLRHAFVGKIAVHDNGPAGGESPFGGKSWPRVEWTRAAAISHRFTSLASSLVQA